VENYWRGAEAEVAMEVRWASEVCVCRVWRKEGVVKRAVGGQSRYVRH
jgi:hypothetical protein